MEGKRHVLVRPEGRGEALAVLAEMMDLNDPATARHATEVADLVPLVGGLMGMDGEQLDLLELAARFHDIGKLAVPEEVLEKPGPLNQSERRTMACHVEWGVAILRHIPGCDEIATIVRHHHERYDGGGYPDGLKGAAIPVASRIIAACDAYGAMASNRPYRRALPRKRVVEELAAGSGAQFDPEAVGAVLQVTAASRHSGWSPSMGLHPCAL